LIVLFMPIEVGTAIEIFDQDGFHALDRRIMRIVFDVHNEFGRLLDESLYKCEIAARCAAAGILPAEREVRIRVSHKDFVKDYFMDLLFGRGFMLEAKTAERVVPPHRNQGINYLLLTGMQHGKLVNLRAERVQQEYLSTTLTLEERRRVRVVDREWSERSGEDRQLKAKVIELVEDWGAFLDVNLYREALIHFLGGIEKVSQKVGIFCGARRVGEQNLHLLNERSLFAVTAKPRGSGAFRDHLERLLHHTRMETIQWVNLNRHLIEFVTLSRRAARRTAPNQDHDRDAVIVASSRQRMETTE
jgi:GxxExxY protein